MNATVRPLLFAFIFFISLHAAGQYMGWTQVENFGGTARHRAVGITIGNRGYMGLGHINAIVDILYDDWWEYDPGTNSWTQKATFPGGQRMHCSAFSVSGKGYVGFGRDANNVTHNDLFEYDPLANTWTQKASMPGSIRRGAVGMTIGSKGYVGTGFDGSNYHRDFWEYDPSSNVWTQKMSFPGTRRTSAVGFGIGSRGYLGTGDDGGPTSDFYEYDPASDTWTMKASVPPVPRMEACGFVLNGFGYIVTGSDAQSGNCYQDCWRYDPAPDTWTQVQDFPGAARRYMSSFTIGPRAYAGLGTSGINYNDLWNYGNLTDVSETLKQEYEVNVFPNPVTSGTTFSIKSNAVSPLEKLELQLFDAKGCRVRKMEFSGCTFYFERGDLDRGAYLYNIYRSSPGELIAAGKLIVQ